MYGYIGLSISSGEGFISSVSDLTWSVLYNKDDILRYIVRIDCAVLDYYVGKKASKLNEEGGLLRYDDLVIYLRELNKLIK